MPPELRDAVVDDIAEICAIETLPDFRLFIGSWSAEQHRALLTSSDARYLVAVDDEGVVDGFAILRGITSENRSMELARLAVRVPNQGTGRMLLNACLRTAFGEKKAHRLWLDVFEGNVRAQHVYRDAGFRVDGVFRESILLDGAFHSMLLMSMLEQEYRETLG